MPKLPVIVAERGINTGTTGAQASPRDFYGGGLDEVARGLGSVGNAAMQIASVKERQASMDGERWATERESELEKFGTDLVQSLKNDENAGEKFESTFKSKIAEVEAQAPNPQSVDALRKRALGLFNSGYRTMSEYGARVKAQNIERSVDGLIEAVTSSATGVAGDPDSPIEFGAYVDSAITRVNRSIDSQLGGVAPALADSKKRDIATQLFWSAVNNDRLDVAGRIANTHVKDEKLKASFLNVIEQHQDNNRQQELFLLGNDIEQTKFNLLRGEQAAPIPVERFLAAHKDQSFARELYKKHVEEFNNIASASAMAKEAVGMNAAVAESKFSEAIAGAKTKDEQDLLKQVYTSYVKPVLELQTDDPEQYMRGHHKTTSALFGKVQEADAALAMARKSGVPADRMAAYEQNATAARNAYTSASLAFQGYPPAGTPEDQRAQYVGMPTLMRRVLTNANAKDVVQQIQSGDIDQARQTLEGLMNRFSDPEHAAIAFRDLTAAKLDPAYQAAWLNNDTWFSSKLWQSIRSKKAMEMKDSEKANAIAKIHGTEEWMAFSGFMDATDREVDLPGWESAILAYGAELGDFKTAAKHVLGTNLIQNSFNGQRFPIHRRAIPAGMQDSTARQRLGVSLRRHLENPPPIDDMDIGSFTGAGYFPAGAEFDEERKRQVEMLIRRDGAYYPNADGTRLDLWVLGVNGQPFQVRRKSNGKTWSLGVAEAIANADTPASGNAPSYDPTNVKPRPVTTLWKPGS